jgi:UDP-2-acetamido-2,6-beta-L-arabino-hexul-4-ose reductase
MKKIRVGITGQNGFIGWHLINRIKLLNDKFEIIFFEKSFFLELSKLEHFVQNCDVIIHLAALNRHNDEQFIYDSNINLVKTLINALENTQSKAKVILSSSLQENNNSKYGESKKIGRELLLNWASKSSGKVVGMIIPNVFGAFGKPFYNSFIATFCYKLANNESPEIINDNDVSLIYIDELVDSIIMQIENNASISHYIVTPTKVCSVSSVLSKLVQYKLAYLDNGTIPVLNDKFDIQLFNTFRSYISIDSYFPRNYIKNVDERGAFVEIMRVGIGGQFSFSSTFPGAIRGNHFHTRKIERFSAIKGKALIQLRKVGTDKVYDFYLDGENPTYVDMPIWFTHNIKNIGEEDLYTNFWINEVYDPNDSDTFFEIV